LIPIKNLVGQQLGFQQLKFFCREFWILEPKIFFFGKKALTFRVTKGEVGWLVGSAYGLLFGMYVMENK